MKSKRRKRKRRRRRKNTMTGRNMRRATTKEHKIDEKNS